MMKINVKIKANEDLQRFDKTLQVYFKKHIDKLSKMPHRKKQLKYGIPYHREDVTKQARLVFDYLGNTLIIVRCFATHKDYEKWYLSYKSK